MNKLSSSQRAKIIQLLVEGNSMRSASRISDCSINTVYALLAEVGAACEEYQDKAFINLPCKNIQVDEIWSFVYAKKKNADPKYKNAGDAWTWVSICADTKIVPCWYIGRRNKDSAIEFMSDLQPRFKNRIQLSSDGLGDYIDAVEQTFGIDVDYGMLVKKYEKYGRREKYAGAYKRVITGNPDPRLISTSFVERQNLSMRMGCRRFTRETNAFSKKLEKHALAVALHFMHYNFCRIHKTLRVTPAMAAGVTDRVWEIEDIARMTD